MHTLQKLMRQNAQTLAKTGIYYLIHITVAAAVAYAVTGDLLTAITLSLLEPTVQAFAFFFHEKVWQRWQNKHPRHTYTSQPS
jgi:uncharacterized membrane protein